MTNRVVIATNVSPRLLFWDAFLFTVDATIAIRALMAAGRQPVEEVLGTATANRWEALPLPPRATVKLRL